MKKTLAFTMIFTLVLTVTALAQMEKPKRGAEHDKLNFLVGKYGEHTKIAASAMGPAAEAKGKSSFKWILDKMWLKHSYESSLPGYGEMYGHGMMTFDPVQGNYVSYWYDNWATAALEFRGKFNDAGQLVLHNENLFNGQKMHHRITWTNKDNSVHFSMAISMDGKNFQETMASEYKRLTE